jgi:hypothetical protein
VGFLEFLEMLYEYAVSSVSALSTMLRPRMVLDPPRLAGQRGNKGLWSWPWPGSQSILLYVS